MVIGVMLGIIALFALAFFTIDDLRTEKACKKIMDEYWAKRLCSNPLSYSISDYYGRMEKYQLSLQAEKESREPYLLILWWGFDGLRLNEDDTTEWISRRPTPKQTEIKHQSLNPLITQISQSACQSTSAQIASLQSQMQQCMNTAAQMQQYQNIINALHPASYPAYPTYYGASQYTPNYNHYYYGFPTMGCQNRQENKD